MFFHSIEYWRGVAEILQTPAGVYPARMTAALREFYSRWDGAATRAACTAGVRLDFMTAAPRVALRLSYGRACRPLKACSFFVDGRRAEPVEVTERGAESEFVLTTGGGQLRRIEIYLPHCHEVFVAGVNLSDGAGVETAPAPAKRWLAIGDSITQGMTAAAPADTWAARVGRMLDWDLHNIAVGGAVMEAKVGDLALALPWEIASVAFGVNDFNQHRPLEDFQRDTTELLARLLQRAGIALFLLTPIPWVGGPRTNRLGLCLEDYRQVLRDAARRFPQVRLIEGAQLVEEDARLFVDGVHPNDAGMAQFAEHFVAAVKGKH